MPITIGKGGLCLVPPSKRNSLPVAISSKALPQQGPQQSSMFSDLMVHIKAPNHFRITLHFNPSARKTNICNKTANKQSFTHIAGATLGLEMRGEMLSWQAKG